jgi:hypothetical protein
MVEYECLVIAQVADGVVSIMRVLKCAYFQVRQSVQIKNLLKITNPVSYK